MTMLDMTIYLISFTWAKSRTKFNPKMQDFKHVLDLKLQVNGRLNNLILSTGFEMFKPFKWL